MWMAREVEGLRERRPAPRMYSSIAELMSERRR